MTISNNRVTNQKKEKRSLYTHPMISFKRVRNIQREDYHFRATHQNLLACENGDKGNLALKMTDITKQNHLKQSPKTSQL